MKDLLILIVAIVLFLLLGLFGCKDNERLIIKHKEMEKVTNREGWGYRNK